MARLLFEEQGIRTRRGRLAHGVDYVVYSDSAGTVLADISATSGGVSIASSTVTTADIAGLGPASFRFYGPPSGQDTLFLRCPDDISLGVQEIEADTDERLDVLEAGGGVGAGHPDLATHDTLGLATDAELSAHALDTSSIHGITDTTVLATDAEVTSAVSAHAAGTDPHGDRAYADAIAQGLDVKAAAVVASTGNLTLSGEQTIDGVLTSASRVLVKNQTAGAANGIYVSAAGAWARAADADTGAEVDAGTFVFVEGGTVNGGTGWAQTVSPVTLGTTALVFSQFSAAGTIIGGAGLVKTGNTLDVVAGTGIAVAADTVGIAPGGITDTQVSGSAAIAESKLALSFPTHAQDHAARHAAAGADPLTGYVQDSAHTLAAHDTLGLVTDAILAAHEADTTVVHGITDTSALATTSGVTAAVSTHAGLADPHTGYVLESLYDAKGDLLAGSAADTAARLAVGANDTRLTPDSATATGLKWDTLPEVLAAEPIGGGTNDGTALQTKATAAGIGTLKLRAGKVYRLTSVLTLPADCTLDLNGSTLEIGAQGEVVSGGEGVTIRNGLFYFAADAGLLGNERAVHATYPRMLVTRCRFEGNGFRHGVYGNADAIGTESCDELEVSYCSFDTTGYAVFCQGNSGTSFNNAKIHHNVFRHIRRGDAIEINVGDDTGFQIHHNDIDDVTTNGTSGTGFGIGIAGGGYGGALATQSRDFVIHDNVIRNCATAGIHVEACNNFQISRNLLLQTSPAVTGTGNGIEVWGSEAGTTEDNVISGWNRGIQDATGFSGAYVVSTHRSLIRGNRIADCDDVGIYSGVAGQNKRATVEHNLLESCLVGIFHDGGAAIRLRFNEFHDCTTPLKLDMNTVVKSAINATTTRFLEVIGNRAFTAGVPGGTNIYTSIVVDSLIEDRNTFLVGSTGYVQVFTTPGAATWNKPAGVQTVEVTCIGGGGGGGSGRRGAAGTVRAGGGGGAAGGTARMVFPATVLGTTETVTVGGAGGGGAAKTTDDTGGSAGSPGGASSFGSWLRGAQGTGGAGGTTASAAGGTGGSSQFSGGGGGASSGTGAAGGNGSQATGSGGGGAAGGGITSADAVSDGGTGGITASSSSNTGGGTAGTAGGAGGAGTSFATNAPIGGGGGGGGASSITGVAGTGGAGGKYGAAGGGGGASLNGNNSGAGGAGADGIVIVIGRL